jgi:hypothetical protein
LLTRYANERLLYRLANTPSASRFVLKGAALFALWTGHPHRATRDIDLLGSGDPSEAHVRSVFADVIALSTEDDGVVFDATTLAVGPIREDQEYGGVRVFVTATVDSARVKLQVDVGFGDAITPPAVMAEFPVLLAFASPRLRVYPRETVVAEKLEAMVKLGLVNTRMKDFYDVAALAQMFPFTGDVLVQAIRATFERRATPVPSGLPIALTPTFAMDAVNATRWGAFLRKSGAHDKASLPATISAIVAFVEAPLAAAATKRGFAARWPVGGPWE